MQARLDERDATRQNIADMLCSSVLRLPCLVKNTQTAHSHGYTTYLRNEVKLKLQH